MGVGLVPFYLVYVSTASARMDSVELHALLTEARDRNADLQVTGALLYHDGNFMQVLEGDEPVVRNLYEQIGLDPRHHSLEVVIDGHSEARQFDDWSMAFRDLSASEDDLAAGFSAFMQGHSDTFGDRPTIAQRLLLSFRRSLTVLGH